MTPQLSFEDIEKMRALVNAHDKNNQGEGMKEFDLNNPPKKPYRHIEYPKHLGYDKKCVLLIANSVDDEEKLSARVFSKTPPPPRKAKHAVPAYIPAEQVEDEASE